MEGHPSELLVVGPKCESVRSQVLEGKIIKVDDEGHYLIGSFWNLWWPADCQLAAWWLGDHRPLVRVDEVDFKADRLVRLGPADTE